MTPHPDRVPWRVPPALATVRNRDKRMSPPFRASMPLNPAKKLVDNPDPLADPDKWANTIAQIFANPARTGGFLAEAEKAERACPGDPTHSLHGGDGGFARRRARQGAALSQALRQALRGEQNPIISCRRSRSRRQKKLIAARALLERHGLTDWRNAMGSFPGGWERRRLARREARRHHGSRASDPRTRKPAVKPARRPGAPEESSADQIRRAAAGTSAAGGSAGDAGLGAAAESIFRSSSIRT